MNSVFSSFASKSLVWSQDFGIGYYPVSDSVAPYDDDYFNKYVNMGDTVVGKALNQRRVDLVNKYSHNTSIIDIGIGAGDFLKTLGRGCGFDINETAIDWLVEKGRFGFPSHGWQSMTFWDSLEHIHDPQKVFCHAKDYVFVSIPIFTSLDHILSSKHYRKDEHCWYFTKDGFINFMNKYDFWLVEHNTMEQEVGREDIHTFVFRRMI